MGCDSGNVTLVASSRHARVHQVWDERIYKIVRHRAGLVAWQLIFTKQAQKDATKLALSSLKDETQCLLGIFESNPFQNPPPFEGLVGDLAGTYSRRTNVQCRLVYQVIEAKRIVKVLRLWRRAISYKLARHYTPFVNGHQFWPQDNRT